MNNIDDDILYKIEENRNGNENISVSNNFNNLIILKNVLNEKKRFKILKRKRIKFNEKRKRLNYYDKLFRYNNERERKILPSTNFSSLKLKKDDDDTQNLIIVSSFEKKSSISKERRRIRMIAFSKKHKTNSLN